MKKLLVVVIIFLMHARLNAQQKIGVIAGGVLSQSSFKANDGSRFGYYAGVTSDITLTKSLSLRPQLKYIKKGERNTDENEGNYHYLELPINIMANIPTRAGKFSIGGGPALSYMLAGSWVYKDGVKEKIYFDFDDVNQFDIGLNLQAGYEIPKGIFFSVNYTLGFSNVWAADINGTNKNRALGFGVGFMF